MEKRTTQTNRTVATKAIAMLLNGHSKEITMSELDIPIGTISLIENTLGRSRLSQTHLGRLSELPDGKTLPNAVVKEENAKALCRRLIQAGLNPGQVHICTGLTIHQCRHIYKLVRLSMPVVESIIPMPRCIISQVIMSIFATHYIYLQSLTGTKSVSINNAVIAWTRTIAEVKAKRLYEFSGFDERMLSLGSLFEVSRGLREVRANPESEYAEGKRVKKISHGICPSCNSHYVWHDDGKGTRTSQCCFCQLAKEIRAKK